MTETTSVTSPSLQDAFGVFNQLSTQLIESYRILERHVSALNEELQSSHAARLRELTEKEQLAQRLSSVLQTLPGGVLILDGSGNVIQHNAAASDLLGEPLHGAAWSTVIARAFAPRYDDGHEVSLVDGRRVTLATCPMVNEPGQILLLTDVTEMRALQDRLNHQQRLVAMGEMAAALAHQIRTPLASAMLYSSHLKRHDLPVVDRERFVEKVHSRLAHLERLVTDMLLYARSGHTGVEDNFSVQELFDDLDHSIDVVVLQSKTHLFLQDDTSGGLLLGNRQMLVSAMANLAVNAIQAMGEGGRLRIKARRVTSHIEIQINDNGPGMSAEQLERIFTPFFTTRRDGNGLGLAVVRAVIAAHKGDIWVESKLHQGTTFSVRLPGLEKRVALDEQTILSAASISRAG